MRLPRFEVNAPLRDATGRLVYVADFLWPELRAVLEIDSAAFHLSAHDWRATMDRHNRLTRAGLAVAHYAPIQVQAGALWAREVEDWLRRRAVELAVPYRPALFRPGAGSGLTLPGLTTRTA